MEQAHQYVWAPSYRDEFCHRIGVLQQLQTLLGDQATLDDVAQLVQSFRQEFGAWEPLEGVIQALVSQALEAQVIQRKRVSEPVQKDEKLPSLCRKTKSCRAKKEGGK